MGKVYATLRRGKPQNPEPGKEKDWKSGKLPKGKNTKNRRGMGRRLSHILQKKRLPGYPIIGTGKEKKLANAASYRKP